VRSRLVQIFYYDPMHLSGNGYAPTAVRYEYYVGASTRAAGAQNFPNELGFNVGKVLEAWKDDRDSLITPQTVVVS
jgi:hypothetical protein